MTTRDELIEAVRAFVRDEVAHDPALPLGPTEPLISGGILTSLDLVSLTVFLEKRFGVVVPDAMVTREHLDTLEQIAALVLARKGVAPAAAPPPRVTSGPTYAFLPSFRRRAGLTLLAIAAGLALVDRGVGLALTPAARTRLEGDHRRVDYAYRSLDEELARHDLGLHAKAPDEIRIVGQGDSGTFGSYLEPEEACYAVAGRALAAAFPTARVYNVSHYGQSFAKDAEMLEADLVYAPDVVLVAFCTTHFDTENQDAQTYRLPTDTIYNRALLERFLDRVPGGRVRPELAQLEAVVADSEARAGFRLRHALESVSAIASEQNLLGHAFASLHLMKDVQVEVVRDTRMFATCRTSDAKLVRFTLDDRATALLEAIVARAHAAGVEVVLVWEPEPRIAGDPPVRWPFAQAAFDAVRAVVERIARAQSVPLIDCCDLLSQDQFMDSSHHWTREGNERFGVAIAEGLRPVLARIVERRRAGH